MNLNSFYDVNVDLFEKLNNFNLLEYLELKGFIFNNLFTLKLSKLRSLILYNCNNITFSQNCCLNINQLHLSNCIIIKQNNLLKFPLVEDCKFILDSEDKIKTYNSIIDYSSLKKVKKLSIEVNDFLNLENNPLEELIIEKNIKSKEIEIKMIEKVMSINTLKTLALNLEVIDFNEILNLEGKNTSLENLCVEWHNEKDCLLKNIHIKFPNLSNIFLKGEGGLNDEPFMLNIKEDFNSKIDQIFFRFINENTEIYCQSFENLKTLVIASDSKLVIAFPIFLSNDKIIFKSLTYFSLFYAYDLPLFILNNLFDNLDKMPNLCYFDINIISSDINEESYIKIIKNIVQHEKINYIKIKILMGAFIDEFDSFEEDNNSYIAIYNPKIGIYVKRKIK